MRHVHRSFTTLFELEATYYAHKIGLALLLEKDLVEAVLSRHQ